MTSRVFRLALAAALLPLTACGATTATESPAPAAPATTSTTAAVAPATTTPAAKTTTPKTSVPKATTAKVTKIKVPNGVGLDYQSAQDRWRAAGLHVAPAVDATGQHRLPLIDSNWLVLAQNLKAGSKVPRGSFITATVKKNSD